MIKCDIGVSFRRSRLLWSTFPEGIKFQEDSTEKDISFQNCVHNASWKFDSELAATFLITFENDWIRLRDWPEFQQFHRKKKWIGQTKRSTLKIFRHCSRNIATHFCQISRYLWILFRICRCHFPITILLFSLWCSSHVASSSSSTFFFPLFHLSSSCSSFFFFFFCSSTLYRIHFEWQTTVILYIDASHKTLASHKIRMVDLFFFVVVVVLFWFLSLMWMWKQSKHERYCPFGEKKCV